MPTRRRTITRVVVSLLLGALTTIAVAWGIAAWMPHRGWTQTTLATPDADSIGPLHGVPRSIGYLYKYETLGATRHVWDFRHTTFKSLGALFMLDELIIPVSTSSISPSPPRWGDIISINDQPPGINLVGGEHATGFPFICLTYSIPGSRFVHVGGNSFPIIEAGIDLTPHSTAVGMFRVLNPGDLRALPLRPLWFGFLANSALYAVLWFWACTGVAAVVRHRRSRVGLCPHCRYSRAGLRPASRCPECGQVPFGDEHQQTT